VAIEQKVDKLEEALMRLAYIQQKTEMELQSFKDEMLDFKNEMKVFKDEMLFFWGEPEKPCIQLGLSYQGLLSAQYFQLVLAF
jgi:hypothetical protein